MKTVLGLMLCLLSVLNSSAQNNQWTWLDGDNYIPEYPVYGPKGLMGATYNPGSRTAALNWKDPSGNTWIFGGYVSTVGGPGLMNDLWKYSSALNQWSFMGGSTAINQPGNYGTMGISAPENLPPCRSDATTWVDAAGDLWLFGGAGYYFGFEGFNRGDLWRYSPSTGQWTWVSGDNFFSRPASYGTVGIASPTNQPGSRYGSSGWQDDEGNFWLFGGYGVKVMYENVQNDLWKYNPAINQWACMGGKDESSSPGNYGIKGQPSAASLPPARAFATAASGDGKKFWLYGGAPASVTMYGDCWMYNKETLQWTWVSGDQGTEVPPTYGSMGVADPLNNPGGREESMGWNDNSGNFWLFGGRRTIDHVKSSMNDLWKFSPTQNSWTWITGDSAVNKTGQYGTKGVPSSTTKPGARVQSATWVDNAGNLSLLGGRGYGSLGFSMLNDLWKYSPVSGQWTWTNGDVNPKKLATYGVKGVASPTNNPGGRSSAVAWTDDLGNMWMFGGSGYGSKNYTLPAALNDLWKYSYQQRNWIWMGGDSTNNSPYGTYGSMGVPGNQSRPGGRNEAASWKDEDGNFWMFGGSGYGDGILSSSGFLNDLWKFSPTNQQWTWVSGYSAPNRNGIYGQERAYSSSYVPGSRYGASAWADHGNGFCIFGGFGYDGVRLTELNDLWRFVPGPNYWALLKGEPSGVYNANYGTMGVSAPTNRPGRRTNGLTWTDRNGTLYLFGGQGDAENGNPGILSDLWSFDLFKNEWTWIKGNKTPDARAVYGTKGVESSLNAPGATGSGSSWTDYQGNFWLFGGNLNSNELWRYSPTRNSWTWMAGDTAINQPGTYGTKGMPGINNTPSSRFDAVAAKDSLGNFLLFGGNGYSVNGADLQNDLWIYAPAPTVLPVKLSYFGAKKLNEEITVNWTTAAEESSSFFIVERSSNGIDFTAVATVVAATNSSAASNFQFIDHSPLAGKNYYRLKMVDQDRSSSYSSVALVDFSLAKTAFRLVKNPAHNMLEAALVVPDKQVFSFIVKDMTGKTLVAEQRTADAGSSKLMIDISHLVNGSYVVTASCKLFSVTQKFVKQ